MLPIQTVAEILNVSVATVRKAIKELGIIGRKGERGQYTYSDHHIDQIKKYLKNIDQIKKYLKK